MKELNHLLNKVNKVTAYHRHGNPISPKALDELSNAQIEYENSERETERRRKICISGSTRFIAVIAVIKWLLEKEGNIVLGMTLLPDWYTPLADHVAEAENCANDMDKLHLAKIEISDELFVVNKNGYIGQSTQTEIEYATKLGKKITYFTESKYYKVIEELQATYLEKKGIKDA